MTLHSSVTNPKSIEAYKTLENRFNTFHSNKYDYSKAVYINNCTKMIIACPIHGEFEQTSANHLKSGCIKCGGKAPYKTEEFLSKAKKVHGNRYLYLHTFYTASHKNLIITCRIHGDFSQIAGNHLHGAGCPKCSIIHVSRIHKKSLQQFIQDAQKIHANNYDYSNSVYINDNSKIDIICKIHGAFKQTASDHLQGKGCLLCGMESKGWGPSRYLNKPTILYVLKLSEELFKVGITSQATVSERYSGEFLYPCVYQIHFTNGEDAWYLEKKILNYFKSFKYKGTTTFFKYTKNTEIISINPVNYIKEQIINQSFTLQNKEGSQCTIGQMSS